MSALLPLRRTVQCLAAVTFLLVPLLNLSGNHFLSGNLLSFSIGPITLADPLAVLQVFVGTHSGTAAMFLAGGLALLPALVLGPIFCSWLCPCGLFSEIAHGLRNLCHVRRTWRPEKNPKSEFWPFILKAGIVGAGIAIIAVSCSIPLLNQLSLPGWYTRTLQKITLYREVPWGAALVTAVPTVEMLLGRRVWCRYICPQSVLICLAGLLLPVRLRLLFTPPACICGQKRPCAQACSLGLNPRATGTAQLLQCTNCGDCVDACQQKGKALNFCFRQIQKKKDSSISLVSRHTYN